MDQDIKSQMTAWNTKGYDGAQSCLRHVAVLLQINPTCCCRIYIDIILSLIPNLPYISVPLTFSDLNYFKLNISLCEVRVHLILPQLIIPEGYQYKAPNYKFCPASCSFIRSTSNNFFSNLTQNTPNIRFSLNVHNISHAHTTVTAVRLYT